MAPCVFVIHQAQPCRGHFPRWPSLRRCRVRAVLGTFTRWDALPWRNGPLRDGGRLQRAHACATRHRCVPFPAHCVYNPIRLAGLDCCHRRPAADRLVDGGAARRSLVPDGNRRADRVSPPRQPAPIEARHGTQNGYTGIIRIPLIRQSGTWGTALTVHYRPYGSASSYHGRVDEMLVDPYGRDRRQRSLHAGRPVAAGRGANACR